MSLVDTLDLMLGQLDTSFYTSENQQALQKLGKLLPLVERGGFECRLTPAEPIIDFQQCILPEEFPSVIAHLQKQIPEDSVDYLIWDRLFELLIWAQSTPSIIEIRTEYDTDSIQDGLPLPSVFAGFTQQPADQHIQTTAMLDYLFGREAWQSWQSALNRCFAACKEDVFISHVGAMLSRGSVACRVNVKRLTTDTLLDYLQAIGWQRDKLPDKLLSVLSQCDRFTLALDVNQQVLPRIGLECIMLDIQKWDKFLGELSDHGWMTHEQAVHLQKWIQVTTPSQYPQSYPEHHLIASLWRPTHEFSRFIQRISHVKLVYHPDRPIQSKGYLWFEHEWESLNT